MMVLLFLFAFVQLCFGGTLDQAVAARESGDYAGAAALLETVHPLLDPGEEGRWNLERGLAEDLRWNPAGAEPYYRAAIDIGGDAGMEARYHLAVVLDDLGRIDEARAELHALLTASSLNPEFVPVLRIEQGVIDIHQGRFNRGVHLVQSGIKRVADPKRHAWMIGRGRFAVLAVQAHRAEQWELRGRDWADHHALVQRVRMLKQVEAELFQIIKTEEPEWITASLLRVGDTYADLADDLAHAPPPAKLTEDEAAIYTRELAEKANGPRTKAYTLYDHGVAFANRMSWQSPIVDELREKRDELSVAR